MYIFIVEYLGARVAFKTCADAEKYVEIMYGDRTANAVIQPCLMVGDGDE